MSEPESDRLPGNPARGGWSTCSAPNARSYERLAGMLLGGMYRKMAADLASRLDGVASPDVLEIGPGPGHLAVELARRIPSIRLTGLDIDPEMVGRAAARARAAGVADRVTFTVGDVSAIPHPDASFDLVTSSLSAHHWPDGGTAFAEIRRVLRAGGRALVFDLSDRWGHLERRALPLARAAEAGGFRNPRVTPFRWPGPIAFLQRLDAAPDDEPANEATPASAHR